MRVFNTLKWAALPLAFSLSGCSLFGGGVGGTPATLLAYISLQSLDQINVVSLIQRNPVGEPIPAGSAPANMALNPRSDREYLYVANNSTNTVSFLNVRTRQQEVPVLSGANPWDVAITPDGRYLYVTNTGDGTVAEIDVEGRQRRHLFSNLPAGFKPRGIATHPADPSVTSPKLNAYVVSESDADPATATTKGQVVVLTDRSTGTTIDVVGAGKLWKAAVSMDGTKLLVTDRSQPVLWAIDISSTTFAAQQIQLPGPAWDVVVSPNKQKPVAFVSLPEAGTVVAIDLTTNTRAGDGISVKPPEAAPSLIPQPQALALNSTGTELWVALAGSNQVVIIPNIEGTTMGVGPRFVNFSYTPGQTGSPEDIVLGRGVQ